MKKLLVPLLLCLSFFSLTLFLSFKPGPQGDGDGDDPEIDPQAPPLVENILVQKLAVPLADGSNMKIKVVYAAGYDLPAVLNITTGTDVPTVLRDDGTGADEEAGDGAYTGYLTEDIANFLANIQTAVNEINARGGYITFTGHTGEFFGGTVSFDTEAFSAHGWVEVEAQLEPFCNYGVTRQQSLFITDLSVVEDGARTCNVVAGTGNPTGAWTFCTLMRNIINTNNTGVDVKAFLKNWVKTFMVGGTAKNGQPVAGREKKRVLNFMITPWLNATGIGTTGINGDNWESYWNASDGEALLQNAPFKLTAIVNRIDLRQNTGYMTVGSGKFNAGETRFIFTLINTQGKPPVHDDQGLGYSALDWEGMNIIFEYGNVQGDLCALKQFGEQWQHLSTLALGSTQFNDALEAITNTVTTAGAAPSKPNGSAINQIRTNERVFAYIPELHLPPWREWDKGFWELRQYELNASGQLVLAPVTNTPTLESNTPANVDPNSVASAPQASLDLLDWMNLSALRRLQVSRGTHKFPDAMLAGSAIGNYQYAHYWDMPWDYNTPHWNGSSLNGNNPTEKQMRQQVSLNTCQGCHTGETKTIFTHVIPREYGASANYWSDPPYVENRKVDDRFNFNDGTSWGDQNYVKPGGSHDRVIVSSFLTGRNYTDNQYTDDDPGDWDDNNMYGLFYVNDPNNTEESGDYNEILPLKRWGYNDLLRRHQDLCKLVNNSCDNSFAAVAQAVRFQPFALGSH